ncbi:MAG: tRNA uridine-5-carboxymethylaminomethyl(34) synthesis GTPase MnmE [Rudaea sp.]
MLVPPASAAATATIAAIATAPGAGGIGVVRLSGPRSVQIALALTGKRLRKRYFHGVAFRAEDGATLDRGLAVRFAAPHSFTGEDVVELHAHGGPVVLDLLLRRTLALGACQARPGEFSERAFLNGKIDLAQAEAVADLIASRSVAAARAATRSLEGDFSRAVESVLAALVHVRTWLESALDFPEEELDFLAAPQLSEQLCEVRAQAERLLADARRGLVLCDGLHVVIVGRPNVGKSSLLNALAQSERAIVTPIPGTTRDVLREPVQLDGIGLTLVDTAGLRESADPVEQEGMRRARRELESADVALLIVDAANVGADLALLQGVDASAVRLIVHNKIDQRDEAPRIEARGERAAAIHLSAHTGAGLDLLRGELARLGGRGDGADGAFSARRRHVVALERVAEHLQRAEALLQGERAGELAAEELRAAQHALGELTGQYTSDDLLGAIFSSFCIGK